MAELNPFNAWRRFLALPNESRTKTIAVAFLVSLVCALMVSAATVILRPIQVANRSAEQQARLEALVEGIPGMSEILANQDGVLSTVVVDLERGTTAADVTAGTLDAALNDPVNWTTLSESEDIAGLGRRPNYAQIYLLRDKAGAVTLAVLPVSGTGYNGLIEAILAVQGDMNTIAGLAIINHSETPGLGARIEEPDWLSQFRGKQLVGPSGDIRFSVARGTAGNTYEVDGITGATRTSNAVTNMIRFWVGPQGYGPLMAAIKRGEF